MGFSLGSLGSLLGPVGALVGSTIPGVGTAIGGAAGSLLGGALGNAQDSSAANAQIANANALAQRQSKLYDTLFNAAQTADQQGLFDPGKQLQFLQQNTQYNEGQALKSLAGAMQEMGYRPGDSPSQNLMSQAVADNLHNYTQQAQQIPFQALAQKQAAYGAANPAALNQGINLSTNLANYYNGQMQNPSGLVNSLVGLLGGGYGAPTSPGAAPIDPGMAANLGQALMYAGQGGTTSYGGY